MLEIGDNVGFSAKWLRSVGEYTGRIPFLRGKITGFEAIGELRIAVIAWHDGTTGRVNVANLAKPGKAGWAAC